MRDFIAAHPLAAGALFGVIVGFAGYNAYRGGLAVGHMIAFDDSARLASEALGG